jgi:RNA polymerase sigma-70 factor, ECF subfamily
MPRRASSRDGGARGRRGLSSDQELMERIRRRDQEALGLLYDRHAPACLALAARILGDRDAGEDVLQEAFVRLWEEPDRYDVARGSFTAFVLSTVRNRSIDRLRRQGARQRAVERAQDQSPPRYAVPPGRRSSTVALAVQQLPQEQRVIIELAYFEGLTQTEISDNLGIPLGTVKSRLRLGMGKLREAFQQMARS